MENLFQQFEQARQNVIKLLENTADIYTVPKGYNNNVFWNAAHLLVTQQLLCYKLANQTMLISDEIVDAFRKGTQAEKGQEDIISIEELKRMLLQTTAQIKEDYASGKFKEYQKYPTSFGVELTCVEDAIAFNNVHEGLHIGYMMAMKKKL